MSDLNNIFLKINRAEKKSLSLSNKIAEYCKQHPINLNPQLREGRLGIKLICQMESMVLPLQEWSLELGEIVYTLRSTLDNLIYMCAQTLHNPPPQPRALQFPIIQDANQYPLAVRDIKPQLPEHISNLLETIQPFQRARSDVEGNPESDPLVLLNWISNHDKHRMPVPFLVPPREIQFSQACEFQSEQEAEANVPPDVIVYTDPLSHGSILFEHKTKHPVNIISGQFKITANVAINTHIGLREITEVVSQLTWYTRLVVTEFSKHMA